MSWLMRKGFMNKNANPLLYAAIGGIFVGIAWLDLTTPLGVIVWLLYLFPIWLLSRLTPFDARLVLGGAAATTGLITADFFLALSGVHTWIAGLNRMIGITLVWIVSLLLVRARRQEAALHADITERRLAEEALQQSEAQFRANFELAAVGQAQLNVDTGRFIRVNDRFCGIAGYARGELLGMTPHDLTHPDDRAVDDPQIGRLLRGEIEEYHCEKRYLRKDGGIRWVRVSARLIRDGTGRPARTISVVEDITERKEAEATLVRLTLDLEHRVTERTKALTDSQQRLRALTSELNFTEQRERRRLAGELHDYLAQLLVVGRMKIMQALQKTGPDGPHEEILEADEMLDRSLAYTRSLVAQLAPPVLQQFGLSAALSWLGEELGRHGLRVAVQVPDQAPQLSADQAGLLFQSARELLMNVVKHALTESATVTLDHGKTRLVVTVQDKGAGFEGADRLDQVTNKFGLFSIRERMHALGGSFTIHSSPGVGTTATLMLPLGHGAEWPSSALGVLSSGLSGKEVRPSSPSDHSALSPQHSALHQERADVIRVLLVDDHAMVREGLRSLLSGYHDIDVVGEAADGEEAVELASRLQPHIIVMDVNMPKMDGIEATRLITQRQTGVVIGLSVNASRHLKETMKEAGALTLLTKESAAESLYRTIKSFAIGTGHTVDDQEPLPFAE